MILTEAVNVKEMTTGISMDIGSFLHIAIGMTELVHRAHKQNELFGNLNPASFQIQLEMKYEAVVEESGRALSECFWFIK